MSKRDYPDDFLARLKVVKNKRAKTVIDHILTHGFITTEELEKQYGYNHPPRAARDVRDEGIPLETFRVKNAEGRTIAAYRFPDLPEIRYDRFGGRKSFSKKFKNLLGQQVDSRCNICLDHVEPRYLQIDHRSPYEISGDTTDAERISEDYMLLCGSCNRAKSWSCEHCANWLEIKSPELCQSCYWAYPEDYKHIALRAIRRLEIVWSEHEVEIFDKLKHRAETMDEEVPDYVKAIIQRHLTED